MYKIEDILARANEIYADAKKAKNPRLTYVAPELIAIQSDQVKALAQALVEALNAPPKWLKELPTRPGKYWYKQGLGEQICTIFAAEETGQLMVAGLDEDYCPLSSYTGLWNGPIPSPVGI